VQAPRILEVERGDRRDRARADRRRRHFATPYYVRFTVADRPGIVAALAAVFAGQGINIDAILQEPGFPASRRPFVVSLDAAPSQAVDAALAAINAFDFHVIPPVAIPVLKAGAPEEAAG
jgi:homoserine dehydrogenase